ncbi:hypothetical protein [Nibrella viscosa]|uniref:hypothetical protein n=1 Tax=Nibrella viscosa TaxID=1084524 RepID=UPI0031F0B11C
MLPLLHQIAAFVRAPAQAQAIQQRLNLPYVGRGEKSCFIDSYFPIAVLGLHVIATQQHLRNTTTEGEPIGVRKIGAGLARRYSLSQGSEVQNQ